MIVGLKKLFNKNIECGEKLMGKFLYFYPSRFGKHHVNRNIIIPADFVVVVVCKGKVTDLLHAGKHTLNESTLLGTYRFMRLGRFSKSGKQPTTINIDLYFVYTKAIKFFAFFSDMPFKKKSTKFGMVKGRANGVCSLQITHPIQLVEYLLIGRGYTTQKEAEGDIGLLIGNKVNKLLEKAKFDFVEILNDKGMITSYLSDKLEIEYEKIGFRIYYVHLKSLNINRSKRAAVNKYIADKQMAEGEFAKEALSLLKGSFIKENQSSAFLASDENTEEIARKMTSSFSISGMKVCPTCTVEYSEVFKYCPHCGKSSED